MTRKSGKTAGVIAPPPLIYGVALVIALTINRIAPLPLSRGNRNATCLAGVLLVLLGLLVSMLVVVEFRRASTAVSPSRPASHLVATGLYRFSRNPDYLGQLAIFLGIAAIVNTWWPLLLLPAVLIVIQRGVIHREERYLEARFGSEYQDYRAQVPRWL